MKYCGGVQAGQMSRMEFNGGATRGTGRSILPHPLHRAERPALRYPNGQHEEQAKRYYATDRVCGHPEALLDLTIRAKKTRALLPAAEGEAELKFSRHVHFEYCTPEKKTQRKMQRLPLRVNVVNGGS